MKEGEYFMKEDVLITCFKETLAISCSELLHSKTINAQNSNKIYEENFLSNNKIYDKKAIITVEDNSILAAAKRHRGNGKIAVLNIADPIVPGGNVNNGDMTVEGILCRSTNLYACLECDNVEEGYYEYHRKMDNEYYSDKIIYTKNITVFKNNDDIPKLMHQLDWLDVDIISCSVPNNKAFVDEKAMFSLYKKRIKNIFEAAIDNGIDVLILGAFGCDGISDHSKGIVDIFHQLIIENNYNLLFKKIVFPIKVFDNNSLNIYNCFYDKFVFSSKKRISILGDSISTLEGYNPKEYNVFYDNENMKKAEISDINDTWWGKVINYLDGELLVNNSYSGSRVSVFKNQSSLFSSGCSNQRTSLLHDGIINPDIIIIYMGINDFANGVEIGSSLFYEVNLTRFYDAYYSMINNIKRHYSYSEIWCCTIPASYMSSNAMFLFPYEYKNIHLDKYNQAIRNIASVQKCKLLDLYKYNILYDSMDGTHPNKEGMITISNLIIKCINELDLKKNSEITIDLDDEVTSSKIKNKKQCVDIPPIYINDENYIVEEESDDTYLLGDEEVEISTLLSEEIHEGVDDDLINKTIANKYEVLKLLGGGYFKTYLVKDKRFNKLWAMKVCNKKLDNNYKPIYNVLLHEVDMVKKLDHPLIPRIVDIIEDDNYTFILKDYIEGESLDTILKRLGTIPENLVIDWGIELCDVLLYLHHLKPTLIHRDIKPQNIILQTNGSIKLVDFGIMRKYEPYKLNDTVNLGTVGYAAPEQYGGMGQTDMRTDIYGLGATLHYLLTGDNPQSPNHKFKPIRDYNTKFSKKLEKIISKCLQIEPNKRYQNCNELLKDLNKISGSNKNGLKDIFRKKNV